MNAEPFVPGRDDPIAAAALTDTYTDAEIAARTTGATDASSALAGLRAVADAAYQRGRADERAAMEKRIEERVDGDSAAPEEKPVPDLMEALRKSVDDAKAKATDTANQVVVDIYEAAYITVQASLTPEAIHSAFDALRIAWQFFLVAGVDYARENEDRRRADLADRDSRDGIDPEVLDTIRAEMSWLGKCSRNDQISMGDLSVLIPALRRLLVGHTTDNNEGELK